MSETSSDRTAAAVAAPAHNDAEKSALQSTRDGDDRDNGAMTPSAGAGTATPTKAEKGKQKMTHEEKEAARTGWRAEVQQIPKQVCSYRIKGNGTHLGMSLRSAKDLWAESIWSLAAIFRIGLYRSSVMRELAVLAAESCQIADPTCHQIPGIPRCVIT